MADISTNIKERVLQITDMKGIAKEKFFDKINMSYGNFKGKSKNTPLNSNAIVDILSIYPDVNPEWPLMGKGKPILENTSVNFSNNIESNVINESRVSYGKIEDDTIYAKESTEEYKQKGIPLLPVNAFAGEGFDIEGINFDIIEDRYEIPLFDGMQVDFLIPVRGSSMYPKYSSGDVVACRSIKELLFVQWNKVYVLDTISHGVIMKRLKKSKNEDMLICKSDNENYEPFEIPKSDIRNMALVVGVIRLE